MAIVLGNISPKSNTKIVIIHVAIPIASDCSRHDALAISILILVAIAAASVLTKLLPTSMVISNFC